MTPYAFERNSLIKGFEGWSRRRIEFVSTAQSVPSSPGLLGDPFLRPLLAADRPPAPLELRRALRALERAIDDYIVNSKIALTRSLPQCFRSRSPRSPR